MQRAHLSAQFVLQGAHLGPHLAVQFVDLAVNVFPQPANLVSNLLAKLLACGRKLSTDLGPKLHHLRFERRDAIG
jgi:hypothetical protein